MAIEHVVGDGLGQERSFLLRPIVQPDDGFRKRPPLPIHGNHRLPLSSKGHAGHVLRVDSPGDHSPRAVSHRLPVGLGIHFHEMRPGRKQRVLLVDGGHPVKALIERATLDRGGADIEGQKNLHGSSYSPKSTT